MIVSEFAMLIISPSWFSNVSSYPEGPAVPGWGPDDPLNATWWHLVTEAMESDPSLVTTFNLYQTKSSILTPACTGDCITQTICSIRSGSASLFLQNCR